MAELNVGPSRDELAARCKELEVQLKGARELVDAYTLRLREVLAERDELYKKYQDAVRELAVARQRLECAGEQMEIETSLETSLEMSERIRGGAVDGC